MWVAKVSNAAAEAATCMRFWGFSPCTTANTESLHQQHAEGDTASVSVQLDGAASAWDCQVSELFVAAHTMQPCASVSCLPGCQT